ncbi:MAG: hypothetical protein DRN30_04475 [Thermoplasmata archaeon]|nr:hypothetical protein [Euryarchaeota archaeon]RLF65213.1 MAG: hypothetical protein DRN30_04475 [Thermoplasmata archaeon]
MKSTIDTLISRLKREVYPLLRDRVSEEEFEREARKLAIIILNYDELKRKIMQKFGLHVIRESQKKKISEIVDGDKRLEVIGKILGVNEVTTERGKFYAGVIADETGSMPFRAYVDSFPFNAEDNVRIINAYAKAGPLGVILYITQNTIIERYDKEIHVVEAGKKYIKELEDGMFGVELEALVLKVAKREKDVEKGPILRGLLCDSTGKIAFSSWSDFDIREGDVVKIVGARVRSYRGIPTLILDPHTVVERIETDISCPKAETLYDIVSRGGGLDVSVQGLIVDVKQGSGIIKRCEACGRILREGGICPEHGHVKGVYDLRARVVIDDGTGALLAVIGREPLEKFLGETLDDLLAKARSDIEFGNGYKYIREKLLGMYVIVRGDIIPGKTGLVFFVNSIEENTLDQMSEKITMILEELS